MKNPYTVPPFDKKKKREHHRYTWWSWHPRYPYWAKSCWGGDTIEEANNARYKEYDRLDNYHNKLIEELDDYSFVEVLDSPCPRLDIWQKIYEIDSKDEKY